MTRQMTAKGFLFKSQTKAAVSAAAFLAQHRAWLETGELAMVTSPILRQLDEGVLLPSPTLVQIRQVVLAHHLASESRKAESTVQEKAPTKDYLVTVYNVKGEVQVSQDENGKIKDLKQGFDHSSLAQGWADRRLFDGAPDWYAVIEHTKIKMSVAVLRADAIARILKRAKTPTMKQSSQTTSKLGFGIKLKESRARFSNG